MKKVADEQAILDRWGRMESLVLEEPDASAVLRGTKTSKLSWKQTYLAMAAEGEDWSDFDITAADGPW